MTRWFKGSGSKPGWDRKTCQCCGSAQTFRFSIPPYQHAKALVTRASLSATNLIYKLA